MKLIPLVLLLILATCACTDTRAEQQRQAIEREINERVEARTKEYAERRLASFRMIVLGSIALVSLIAMCALDARPEPPRQPPMRTVSPSPSAEPPNRRRRGGQGRIIDLGS
jgi:hypothetical protein